MHIAVILPRWIGDAVMATPLLRALRGHFGDRARITGVMRPAVADLLAGTGWIDAVVSYQRHGDDPRQHFWPVIRRLRRDRPDAAIVLPTSLSAASLAALGGARRRIGHRGCWRRVLLTDVFPARHDGAVGPPPQAFMELAAALGVPPGPLDVELAVTSDELARGDLLLARLFPGRSGRLVVLNDNSSNGTARAWGVDKHVRLARLIADRIADVRVLVHCGPADRASAREIVARADSPAVRGIGDLAELPIGLSKAIYARAAAAVSSDSGPRHIAAGFRVPTVALIGPTDVLLGRSDPSRCIEIRRDISCSPCGRGMCPLGHHDCMRLIEADEVAAAVFGILEPAGRAAAV